MALTRKLLSSMGIGDDQADQIIEAHTETVNGLKDERAKLKAEAGKAEELRSQISDLRKELAEADQRNADGDGYKTKYEELKAEYDDYKAKTEAAAAREGKEKAYRELLKDAGISEHRLDFVAKYSTEAIDALELDDDGKPKDADEVLKAIKKEWGDFISVNKTQGASVPNPPENNGGSEFANMSLADKMQYANEHPSDPQVTEWLKN